MKNLMYVMITLTCLMGSILMGFYIFDEGRDIWEEVTGKSLFEEEDTGYTEQKHNYPGFEDEEATSPVGSSAPAPAPDEEESNQPVTATPFTQEIGDGLTPAKAPSCNLDKSARTVAIIAYEGRRLASFSVAKNPGNAFLIPVYVDKLKGPVNVVLGTYNNAMWDFKFKDPADKKLIQKVLVNHMEESAVRNLASETQVIFTRRGDCNTIAYEKWTDQGLKDEIENAYGVKPAAAGVDYGIEAAAISEEILKGASPIIQKPENNPAENHRDTPLKSNYVPVQFKGFTEGTVVQSTSPITLDTLPMGKAGLDALVAQGALRLATDADVEAFKAVGKKREQESGKKLESYGTVSTGTYVLVKKVVTLPKGLIYDGGFNGYLIPAPRKDYQLKGDISGERCYMETGTCGPL